MGLMTFTKYKRYESFSLWEVISQAYVFVIWVGGTPDEASVLVSVNLGFG